MALSYRLEDISIKLPAHKQTTAYVNILNLVQDGIMTGVAFTRVQPGSLALLVRYLTEDITLNELGRTTGMSGSNVGKLVKDASIKIFLSLPEETQKKHHILMIWREHGLHFGLKLPHLSRHRL